VGWLVKQHNGDLHNETVALKAADQLQDLLGLDFLDNADLRSISSGEAASIVSAFPSVRQSLFTLQRQFALFPPHPAKGAILDGRDIGTVICPDAPIKLYVTASPDIRAERRARAEFGEAWHDHFEEVRQQTIIRDTRDSTRTIAPLKPAEDAIIIDTSALTPDQVFDYVYNIIQKHPLYCL
jgi:cytidylate kinase